MLEKKKNNKIETVDSRLQDAVNRLRKNYVSVEELLKKEKGFEEVERLGTDHCVVRFSSLEMEIVPKRTVGVLLSFKIKGPVKVFEFGEAKLLPNEMIEESFRMSVRYEIISQLKGKRLISGYTIKMCSGLHGKNPERKRFTLFYTAQLLHTFIPRS